MTVTAAVFNVPLQALLDRTMALVPRYHFFNQSGTHTVSVSCKMLEIVAVGPGGAGGASGGGGGASGEMRRAVLQMQGPFGSAATSFAVAIDTAGAFTTDTTVTANAGGFVLRAKKGNDGTAGGSGAGGAGVIGTTSAAGGAGGGTGTAGADGLHGFGCDGGAGGAGAGAAGSRPDGYGAGGGGGSAGVGGGGGGGGGVLFGSPTGGASVTTAGVSGAVMIVEWIGVGSLDVAD